MRTTLDITGILYGLVNVPDVTSLISGAVYKDERPLNSTKQDIVCVSTTVDADSIQDGVGYVNFHCPGAMPNHAKLKSVTDAICAAVERRYTLNDYSLVVTNVAGPVKQETNNEWYTTVRVRIRMYRAS